jgi:hypothetical protein
VTVSVSTFPAFCAVGESVTLIGTSDLYDDDAVEWELVSVPSASRLPLGKIVERSPAVVRVRGARLTFHAGNTAKGIPATITCNSNNFVEPGFVEGMALSVAASTSNNGNYTIAKVEARTLTLAANDVLVNESATSNLTAQYVGNNGPPSNVLTFDCSGDFQISNFEYFNFRGQHRLMSKGTSTISVGEYLELPIETVGGHNSTLRVLICGTVVRRAELVRATSDIARLAALDATVIAALAALEGVAVTGIDVDFVEDVRTLARKMGEHFIYATSHPAALDTTNTLLREPAYSVPTAIAALNEAATRLQAHREATLSGGLWHSADDSKNTLQVAPSATTLAQAIVLKADLRVRSFTRHLAQILTPLVHVTTDALNGMDAPLTLPSAIAAYLDFVASHTITAASGEAEGVADAMASWGFRAA